MTEMERSEGDPISMQVNAMSFEEGNGKSMRFQIDSKSVQDTPPVVGTATRGADDDMRVVLTKPKAQTLDFGREVLFPDPAYRASDRGRQAWRRRHAGAGL